MGDIDINDELNKARETAPIFEDNEDFRPFATPPAILMLGVFDGTYFDDDPETLYQLWAAVDRPADTVDRIPETNLLVTGASQSREEWQRKGWITEEDPLGWFQWYARFWLGRRLDNGVDEWQIKRHNSFKARQTGMLRYQSDGGDPMKAWKLRQGFLHWAHDPFLDQ